MAGKTTLANLVLVVVAAAALMEGGAATVYFVGDTTAWTIPSSAAFYSTWAANHTFAVGDILVFNFATGAHDVATVTKTSYDSCSSASPISLQTTGPSNVTLTTSGEHYFICTVGQHCANGQKLSVNVAAAGSPTPSPYPSTASPPAPSRVGVADNDLVFPPVAPLPPSPQSTSRGTIAGVAAGVALVLAALVIALCYWRRRKLPDHFFNVPACLKEEKW